MWVLCEVVDWFVPEPMGEWRWSAACRGTGIGVFYVGKGGSVREAVDLCMGCSVRRECLVYALENAQVWGVWGGLTERERVRVRRLVVLGND